MQRPASSSAPSLGKSLLHEMQMLLRSLQAPGRRRYPHLPAFHKRPSDRRWLPPTYRRAHGIAKHVAPTPGMLESADKRRWLYLNARQRTAALAARPTA